MEAALLAIIIGIIPVLIGLWIEYGILRPKRKKLDNEAVFPASELKLDPQPIPLKKLETDKMLTWPKAINKALEEFGTLHKDKKIRLETTKTEENYTFLFVIVSGENYRNDQYFQLHIDKDGDILMIKQIKY